VDEDPLKGDLAGDDVERRLAAYASARLEPSAGAAARMRASVLAAASLSPGRAVSRRPVSWRPRRWAVAGLLAATLLVAVGVGSALGAGPASPLYGLRLWLETVTLPAEANARADAQLELLSQRLNEARAAVATGDSNAVAAALAAYRAEIEALLATADGDDARLAKLEAALGTHLVALEVLSTRVPDQARDAIANAIDKSSKAVDRVHEAQGNGPDGSPGPDKTPKPGNSNKPDHTPPAGPPGDQP
jgi:hypothetical protein